MLKKILIGCAIVLLLCMIGVGLLVWGVISVTREPEGLELEIESPMEVQAGQTFNLVVHAKNSNKSKSVRIGDVDLSNEYLKGFTVISIAPKPKSTASTDLKIVSLYSSTFNDKIPAGEERAYTFTLKALKAGKYQGDVDIYEGMRSLTQVVETIVTDEKPASAAETWQPVEGKTEFTVVMKAVDPARKIKVIKEVRALKPDLGLKEAKDLVDNLPANVLIHVNRENAEKARKQLVEAGAEVDIK